jgi:hypothetical protein
MIQTGDPQPQPTTFRPEPPADLDQITDRGVGDGCRPADEPVSAADDGSHFMPPPPLPFPRVFPGL